MYKIMMIEDDVKINYLLKEYLEKWNFEVIDIKDYQNVVSCFVEQKPSLVLLDINLPYYDGFYWCREIRKISTVPILMISSRDSDMDKIMGLNQGADDYIEKPVSFELLLTKIQALLRRSYAYLDQSLNIMEYHTVILDLTTGKISDGTEEMALTPNEYKIMGLLMKHPEKIVKRSTIMETLWDDEHFIDDNTLTVNMNRLRKKLNVFPNIKIETIKNEGYRLCSSENI